MMSFAVRVGLVFAHVAFCLCVTAQTVKVTFDDVKGFSTPTNPPGGEVRHFATTPEGGRYTASRGVFYTGCQCVPDDATTVYGAVARVNQPDVVMDFGPLPSTEAQFTLINGGNSQNSYAVFFQYADANGRTFVQTVFVDLEAHQSTEVVLPADGVYHFDVEPTTASVLRGDWTFFIDDVQWTLLSAQAARGVKAVVTSDALPVAEFKKVAGDSVDMNVPLGAPFNLTLTKGETIGGAPVVSTFALSAPIIKTPLASKPLFDDTTILMFDSAAPDVVKSFLPIHLGSATLTIAPSDSSLKPVAVHITIVKPEKLGIWQNDWDDRFIEIAHRTGIPPQLVKGHARQESNGATLNPKNYRYEPCGADLDYVSRDWDGSGPYIDTAPWKFFRAPDPRGAQLSDDDLSPRSALGVGLSDVNVTVRTIYDANENTQHWYQYCKPSIRKQIDAAPAGNDILDFIAQTPTASSYGIFQMMYGTAIGVWDGITLSDGTVSKAPHYLFDTDANIAIGGGTITIGNGMIVKHFKIDHPAMPAFFGDYEDLRSAFEDAYQHYNPFKDGYSDEVIAKSTPLVPIRTKQLFQ